MRLDLDQLYPTNSLRKRRELQRFSFVTSLSQSREIFPIAVNGIEQRYFQQQNQVKQVAICNADKYYYVSN